MNTNKSMKNRMQFLSLGYWKLGYWVIFLSGYSSPPLAEGVSGLADFAGLTGSVLR